MRRLTAHYIFPIDRPPIKNGIIELDDQGVITKIEAPGENFRETANLEHYSGIIVPGFINAHCHLELSHLRNLIPTGIGIPGFVKEMIQLNRAHPQATYQQLKRIDLQMWKHGIVAIGDIANSTATIQVKQESPIFYHTFLEVLAQGRTQQQIEAHFNTQKGAYEKALLAVSLVPHSAYALSASTIEWLFRKDPNALLSIHNQESTAEDMLLVKKTGPLLEALIESGIPMNHFVAPGINAFEYFIEKLHRNAHPTLFVHNTYASVECLKKAQEQYQNITFVTCPLSNNYIEGRLAPLDIWHAKKLNVAIGTDSLASNHTLDILEELKAIQHAYQEIPLSDLFKWGTLNGAKALHWDNTLGSITVGKKPGINLITGVNIKELKLTSSSRVKKLA